MTPPTPTSHILAAAFEQEAERWEHEAEAASQQAKRDTQPGLVRARWDGRALAYSRVAREMRDCAEELRDKQSDLYREE